MHQVWDEYFSKCPNTKKMLPPFGSHKINPSPSNVQLLLYHSLRNTLYMSTLYYKYSQIPLENKINKTNTLVKQCLFPIHLQLYRVFRNEWYKSNCTLLGLGLILWFPKGGKIFWVFGHFEKYLSQTWWIYFDSYNLWAKNLFIIR